ncbi:MAG: two-component regulator propeller domain-containing protein, partial [Bacteroidota bacterium]
MFCVLLLVSSLQGQMGPLQHAFYTTYNQEDGLGNGVISDIIQDHTGFIWISTYNGLFRFDGSQFQAFLHDPSDSTTLSHNQIKAMAVDSMNRIWLATDGGGLNCYDPRTEQFKSWIIESGLPNSHPQPRTHSVHVDRLGQVWVGTEEDGICRYHEASDRFACYELKPGEGYPYNVGHAFANDPINSDLLWAASGSYLLSYSNRQDSILFTFNLEDLLGGPSVLLGIWLEPDGKTVWGVTYKAGLFEYNLETQTAQIHAPGADITTNRYTYIKDILPGDEEQLIVAT